MYVPRLPSSTFWCRDCDTTARRSRWAEPVCPSCRAQMANMGTRWSPGRKGTRTRVWDTRRARRAAQKHNRRGDLYYQRPTF